MGKSKIDTTQKIGSKTSRAITYNKRKRGLIKKAIELSLLTEAEVVLIIKYQEKDELIVYQSNSDFDMEEAKRVEETCNYREIYDNSSFDDLDKIQPKETRIIKAMEPDAPKKRHRRKRRASQTELANEASNKVQKVENMGIV